MENILRFPIISNFRKFCYLPIAIVRLKNAEISSFAMAFHVFFKNFCNSIRFRYLFDSSTMSLMVLLVRNNLKSGKVFWPWDVFRTKYSGMDQVKFVEGSLLKIWIVKQTISLQISLGPFFNTLSHFFRSFFTRISSHLGTASLIFVIVRHRIDFVIGTLQRKWQKIKLWTLQRI